MTESEKKLMINQIAIWISKGFTRPSLRKLIEKTYDIISMQAQNKYISLASEQLSNEINVDTLKEMIASRFERLSEKAEKDKKYGDATRATAEMAKILGLNKEEDQQKNITVTISL